MLQLFQKHIDFEQFIHSGIIKQHFPLHQGDSVNNLHEVFSKYHFKLARGFVLGDFEKYMHSLNIIKNYYGESYGFEFAFLIHY